MGIAPRTLVVQKSSHVGAIVGGTIGGVAFIVITALAVYYFVYRHHTEAYRVTAAQYDAGQEIEKSEDRGVHPFSLSPVTPTTVQFARAPESTVGSDLVSPTTVPMLGVHNHGDDDLEQDIAPPSYETVSEADRRASGSQRHSQPHPSVRAEKASLAARLSTGSSAAHGSVVPSSPTDRGMSSSGSTTMYE
jgi:hypothetical protein